MITVAVSVLAISLAGGYLVYFATNWGPWAYSDTVEYFEAAHNWSQGLGPVLIYVDGSVHPLTLRPPLYPILLGSVEKINPAGTLPLKSAARGLDIALFFGFTSLVGLGVLWVVDQPVGRQGKRQEGPFLTPTPVDTERTLLGGEGNKNSTLSAGRCGQGPILSASI